MIRTTTLLASAALLLPVASRAAAQQSPATAPEASTAQQGANTGAPQVGEDIPEEPEIVVVGQKPRGSVIGDIPPEDTLDARDVRATGATSITELLDALAPQIGSAQGRGGERPVLLLNGQRISSFREMRDIPTEAIQRVEILPEEVALKYGYGANQKVVNIVLRQRFRSTVAQVGATAATEGGYAAASADVTRLMIQKNGRTQFNLHATGNTMLTEAERNINLTQPSSTGNASDALLARSLIGTKRDVHASAIFNRQIFGDVSATLNAEIEHSEGRLLIGLGDILLTPLVRNNTADSAHLGTTLNGDKGKWHWNVTGNADWERDLVGTDQDVIGAARNRTRETTTSGDVTATANGNLFKVPAGNASTTLRVGASTVNLDSERRIAGVGTPSSLGRTTGTAAVNVDLPISRRGHDFSALGNLTVNGNAEVDQLSDFGALTKFGAGANWSPVDRLNFVTSWSREEGPPTINQLGDPLLETPGARIFDFTTGQTVQVTAVTGGNPDLQSDRRTVFKLGGYWQPLQNTDLRLRADYVNQRIDRPISNIIVTQAIEAAFPERFVRSGTGCSETPQDLTTCPLVRVDLTPVNFDSSERDTLRVGFDFSKPLKSRRPSPAVIDQIRKQFGFGSGGRAPGGAGAAQAPPPPGPPPEGGASSGGARGGRGGRGAGGGFFGGGSRGRLQFSLTDTITFVDKVTIRPGLPPLDYLNGDAAGQTGGTPRHHVEAQAGWSNNGFGARIGANWRSATEVDAITPTGNNNLHFSPVGTFDLRLFANFGEQPELTLKHPWLRGSSLRLDVTNVFNARPKVNDAFGKVPLNYQPDLLDPLGRTVMISIRKLFLPPPSFFRQQRDREQQAQPTR
jgi:hypothetical protein